MIIKIKETGLDDQKQVVITGGVVVDTDSTVGAIFVNDK